MIKRRPSWRVAILLLTTATLFSSPSCSTVVKTLSEYAAGQAWQALNDAINSAGTNLGSNLVSNGNSNASP